MYEPKLEKDLRCPLEYGLKIFGGKWKTRVVCLLSEAQTLRYSALRNKMVPITDAVLASTLKELIADCHWATAYHPEFAFLQCQECPYQPVTSGEPPEAQ